MRGTMNKTTTGPVALALALGLTAGAADANTLRWAFQGDVLTLDPYAHTESFTSSFLHHLYEPLVRRDANLDFEPALAESWELVEPTRMRFTLRQGVTFHDGSPFTADDVVASIERLRHPDARARGNLSAVTAVEKVDEMTVDIVVDGPYPLLVNDLSGVFIMDREWLEANDALLPGNMTEGVVTYASDHANGTGPFMLESRQPDARTVLVANPDWWDEPRHNLERIEFTPIGSDATRVAALLSGEIDIMFPAPLQDVARLEAAPGVTPLQNPSLRTIMFGLNHGGDELHAMPGSGKNPTADVRVRQALWHAIDMEAIQARVMRGTSRNAGIIVAPPITGYVEEIDTPLAYDPERAKALLAEAGFPDGFAMGLDCSNDRYVNDEEICVAIAGMWAQIGIDVQLTAQTRSNHFAKVDRGETDAYMIGWATLPTMDGFSPLRAMLATRGEGWGGNNPNGFSHPRIDELARAVAVEIDEAKRQAMLQEAMTIARDEVAYLPLHQQPLSWAVRDGVNVVQFPDNYFRAWHYTMD